MNYGRTLSTSAVAILAGLIVAACHGDKKSATTDAGSGKDSSILEDSSLQDAAAGDGTIDSALSDSGDLQDAASNQHDIPSGTVLFEEHFDDADFSSRDWYDGSNGTISTSEHASGSTSSFECTFEQGAQGCSGGKPARHKFDPTPTVYVSFSIKHSANWVGSGHPYHPHMMHFTTTEDGDWVGPANSYLTTYIESPEGKPFLGLQDSKNVDNTCILRNDDSFVGCNGDFDSYQFTEQRSACSCNGLMGDLDGRDCYNTGSYWYSARSWRADDVYFRNEAGPYDKTQWHFIEAYFALNSIANGKGVADGKIRYVYDGKLLISSDHVLMRTGAHPNMQFNQFLFLPYIGDGSPVTQTVWIDDLTVATGKP